jgi:hypothetical protein
MGRAGHWGQVISGRGDGQGWEWKARSAWALSGDGLGADSPVPTALRVGRTHKNNLSRAVDGLFSIGASGE